MFLCEQAPNGVATCCVPSNPFWCNLRSLYLCIVELRISWSAALVAEAFPKKIMLVNFCNASNYGVLAA